MRQVQVLDWRDGSMLVLFEDGPIFDVGIALGFEPAVVLKPGEALRFEHVLDWAPRCKPTGIQVLMDEPSAYAVWLESLRIGDGEDAEQIVGAAPLLLFLKNPGHPLYFETLRRGEKLSVEVVNTSRLIVPVKLSVMTSVERMPDCFVERRGEEGLDGGG